MLTEAEFNEAAERYLNMVYRIALNWFGNVPTRRTPPRR